MFPIRPGGNNSSSPGLFPFPIRFPPIDHPLRDFSLYAAGNFIYHSGHTLDKSVDTI
jgi:hypothetical protein